MADSAFRVREGFAVPDANGMMRTLSVGDFISAKDPLVKSHRHMLESMDEVVEQTTAAPGERRPVDLPSGVTYERAVTPRSRPKKEP